MTIILHISLHGHHSNFYVIRAVKDLTDMTTMQKLFRVFMIIMNHIKDRWIYHVIKKSVTKTVVYRAWCYKFKIEQSLIFTRHIKCQLKIEMCGRRLKGIEVLCWDIIGLCVPKRLYAAYENVKESIFHPISKSNQLRKCVNLTEKYIKLGFQKALLMNNCRPTLDFPVNLCCSCFLSRINGNAIDQPWR